MPPPGFGEIHSIYNSLSDLLIKAAYKEDDEVAARLNATVKEIVEEWKSNKKKLKGWTKELHRVVKVVGKILDLAGYPNPLSVLLPDK